MKKIIFLSLLAVVIMTGCSLNKDKTLTLDEAKEVSLAYINENLMQPGSEVTIKEVTEDEGLYKVIVVLPDGQEIDSYLTKNGKKFFPKMLEIEKVIEDEVATDQNNNAPVPVVSNKTDKPSVELFVMSHCPYGTQIEKGILPVVGSLGDKIDFNVKFCDYAMHGEKELNEQLNQYCIQKEEPAKLLTYLQCFLEEGDGDSCISETGIDKNKLTNCVADADAKYKVSANYKNKNTWKGSYPTFNIFKDEVDQYGVAGSPTLVINGQQVQSGRDSASLLKLICSAFNNQPEECSEVLSNETPAPGFGFGSSGSASDASCN
jgi:glutaredoxin